MEGNKKENQSLSNTKDIKMESTPPKYMERNDKDNSSSSSSDLNDEGPPSLGYFQLYRFATSRDKTFMVIAFLCSVVSGAMAPLNTLNFSQLTQAMIDYEINQRPNSTTYNEDFDFNNEVRLYSVRNAILGTILLVTSYLATMLSNTAAHNQIFTIRQKFLQSALNQDISYYDINESGDFATRMTDDLIKLEDGIGEKAATFFHYLISFLGCIILAFYRGWELTLICLASFPVMLIAVTIVNIMTSKLSKQESQAYGVAGAIAEEVLSGVRTVIAFSGQKKEVQRYKENLVDAKKINIKRSAFNGIGLGVTLLCMYSTYSLAFWYGVGLVTKENYTPGTLVAVFFGVLLGTINFSFATPFIEVFGMAKGAGAKIFSVIESIPVIDPLADRGVKPANCEGNITFKNVHFDYPSRPDVKILQGLNLDIRVGKTVAIVGGSGCGKSTCIQLIQRFYDPLQGSVMVDNNDIRDLSVNWLRSKIGVVGQEPVLFNTTIGENIRYGYESATKEDIEAATRLANAHDFIKKLPRGYDTLVGERGTQLSGGQKQRIAIARALVRNPKILLLDEATSALDNTSEAKVQKALDKASEGRTTIIVAHRLSTIRTADMIVALDKGKVVEQGSHDELMSIKGVYYNLVMTQTTNLGNEGENQKQESKEKRPSLISNISADGEEQILVANEDEEKDEEPPSLSLWQIAKLNGPEGGLVITACICAFLMGCTSPTFAVLFGEIIRSFALGDSAEAQRITNFYCIVFICAGILAGVTYFLSIFLFGVAGEKMTMRLRGDMFEAMLKQEMGWYDDKRNATGALCARLAGEASAVQGATGQRIGTIIQSMATLILAVSLSMYFEYRLGLVVLSFMPFILISSYIHRTVLRSENFGSSKAMERSTKLAVDVIGSIRTVASLGREKMFLDQFTCELTPAVKQAVINTHFRGVVFGIARSVIFYAASAAIFYGGYLMQNKEVKYYNVLRVSQTLILATLSVSNALTFAPNLQKGVQAASNIVFLINRKPKIVDPVKNTTNGNYETKGMVVYDKIDFAYPTRPYLQILQNMSLTVPSGKTVALVGASGCGKSTCIQLLERFYDPLVGQVMLDNKPTNTLNLNEVRKNLGIVSQEPILFDRTIGENIAYGDNSRTPTQQEIIEAAKNANIHNFVTSLPMGYDTRLGSKGAQLSGGQKQRVAIARALLRNPRILLLDEATSALDTESEKIVQEALDKAKLGRTCIMIAHRLSTIKDADLICVFDNGCVSESGTHDELMAIKGIYHRLYTLSMKSI